MENGWGRRTAAVQAGTMRSGWGETAEAIFLTQGFVYASAAEAEARFAADDPEGFIYARYGNPTVAMFEDRIAALEGAEAGFATASGMAAVTAALMCDLRQGDRVVASRALFGSCLWVLTELLPRFGVQTVLVDGTDLDAWKAALEGGARAVFLETVSNPMLEVIDLAAVARLAHGAGARVIVDNVFATPVFQRALDLGADVVVYSATKHIDGQGRCLGGVVLGARDFVKGPLQGFLKHTGAAMSPFNAWVLLKGLETLDLRVRAQAATAAEIAAALRGHPGLARLIWPGAPDHPQARIVAEQTTGAGTILTLDLRGGKPAAFGFLDALRIVRISNNLGDAKSLATHPATTTHQRIGAAARVHLGIGDGVVRLSVGLEDAADLIADIGRALDSAASP
ncbi:MAG TPA: O-succinylhomoserine sulfhydrylase [Rhodobacteraceae bacterium]|jgi:O-succinylhomoserine sulfhydrylase|nr:O-succinylhomoserine sulfhydrylase [Paracoccaceae bacterium]HBG98092.1 O-succinylhomoserine sulfhydrylase [Paracoccaceae bacterium]